MEALKDSINQANESTKANAKTLEQIMTSNAATAKAVTDALARSSGTTENFGHITDAASMPINLGTSIGVKLFLQGCQPPEGWEKQPVENKEPARRLLMAVLEDIKRRGAGNVTLVPSGGTGRLDPTVKQLASGRRVPVFDLDNRRDLVANKDSFKSDQIHAWAAWFNGPADSELKVPDPKATKVQSVLELESPDENTRLAADFKAQLRIQSAMLYNLFTGLITEESLQSFRARRSEYEFEKDDGTIYYDGFTFLWMILDTLKPGTIIDARELEKVIDTATLQSNGNDVRVLISKMKNALHELQRKHGKDAYPERRFVQALFAALLTSTNEQFVRYVTDKQTSWMAGEDFDRTSFINKVENIYKNLSHDGKWKAKNPDEVAAKKQQQQLINLRTEVESLRKEKASSGGGGGGDTNPYKLIEHGGTRAGPRGTAGFVLEKWRTVKQGPTLNANGKMYYWCNDHVDQKDKTFNGLYMTGTNGGPHDHKAWLENKKKRKERGKSKSSETESSEKSVTFDKKTTDGSPAKKLKPTWKKSAMLTNSKQDMVSQLVMAGMSHEKAMEFLDDNIEGDF